MLSFKNLKNPHRHARYQPEVLAQQIKAKEIMLLMEQDKTRKSEKIKNMTRKVKELVNLHRIS